jgi:hypothetical protein
VIDPTRMIETILTTTIPIVIYMWANRRQAKADVESKHEANQRKLDEILTERQYFPAHGHSERSGPLCAEGVTRGPDAR